MPTMKCPSEAMRESVVTQLSAVNVMTPRRFVPAFSSSWAPAFSSTPKSRNADAAVVIARSAARDQHAPKIGGDDAHRHAFCAQALERIPRHQRVALRRQRSPSADPIHFVRYRKRRFGVETRSELVAILDHRRRTLEIVR